MRVQGNKKPKSVFLVLVHPFRYYATLPATTATAINLLMPVNDSTLTRHYALKITLIYMMIRCIPEILFAVGLVPAQTFDTLAQSYGGWLRHIYPVMPEHISSVPVGFQQALALLPVLVIEVILAFLFSVWFLRRKPSVASSTSKGPWIVLILTAVIWSLAVRHQFLAYVQRFATDAFVTQLNETVWLDDLSFLLMEAHWTVTVALYATAPVWTWLPVWLHFRFAKESAFATGSLNANEVSSMPGTVSAAGTDHLLQRTAAFASFFLGCVALHFALVQTTYLGLWPWAAELSQVDVPPEARYASGLPLTVSQIVFSTLMCALAAYVYVRRFVSGTVVVSRQWFFKPLLAGAATYLLTSFLVLVLIWLVIWWNPGVVDSVLRQVSYEPALAIVFLAVLNIGALAVLCFMSDRFSESPRRWSAVLGVLFLCVSVPAYVGWSIAGSNLGIAGGKPGFAVTGKLADARLRNMEQSCTGVVETRDGRWLVGRYDGPQGPVPYVPDGVPDLSTLVPDVEEGSSRGGRLFGSRPVLSTLALLQDDGEFKVMATVPEVACLVVSPDSGTLFLFTGVSRPYSATRFAHGQTAVFRSADNGVTWEWLASGFMAEAQTLAWGVKPTFFSDRQVWSWGAEPPGEDDPQPFWGSRSEPTSSRRAEDGAEHWPTALFYSADQGTTSSVVYSSEPLVAPLSYLREAVGEPLATFPSRNQQRFIVQVDDRRAYAWVSEISWYHVGETSERLRLTTRAELARTEPDGDWFVTRVLREPGIAVRHLSTSRNGKTYAIVNDNEGEWLVTLDTQNGEWVERQRTPSFLPAWLVQNDMVARYFWSNGDYQVVSMDGYNYIPRIVLPFWRDRAEISTDAHFYTRNGGRTWHQLAIPGYLGVMGLSPHGSKVYWSKGNWYRNDEPQQWEYDLAK